MKKLFKTIKTMVAKVKQNFMQQWALFVANSPEAVKPVLASGLVPGLLFNPTAADFNAQGGVTTMAGYVFTIICGVGIIYFGISVFNWVSAIKQEDPDRQGKAIVNIFIAGLLIVIKPISMAVMSALTGSEGSIITE